MLPRYQDIIGLVKKGSTLEAQEQIMSLREGALELQEENQELKSKIHILEAKLQANEDWTKQKEKYVLANPWGRPAQVYALNKENADAEQPHYLCTNCFHNNLKVILNPASEGRFNMMTCPTCKSILEIGYGSVGKPKYAEEINE